MAKDEFDAFMEGMGGGRSRLANAIHNTHTEPAEEITPKQRETLAKSRNEHRGRTPQGGPRVPEYKNKTFRISKEADDTLAKIAAVSGKPFKDLLDEAVEYLAKKYKL